VVESACQAMPNHRLIVGDARNTSEIIISSPKYPAMFIQRRAKKKQLLYMHPSPMLVFGRGRGFGGELGEEGWRGRGGGFGGGFGGR